jgi:hypothetical protein
VRRSKGRALRKKSGPPPTYLRHAVELIVVGGQLGRRSRADWHAVLPDRRALVVGGSAYLYGKAKGSPTDGGGRRIGR